MNALEHIVTKYQIDLKLRSPFHLAFNRLVDLPILFRELDFKIGAEIGVLQGNFSELLCKSNPEMKVYSIDAWQQYPTYNNFRPARVFGPMYEAVVQRLGQYPNNEIIRKWSMDAVKDFEDGSLDWVFIDADHRFEYVTNDIAEWTKKVKVGGIISGHDFGRANKASNFVHVRDVVCAWAYSHKIHPWFVLHEHNETSWMWVKGEGGY